MDTNDDTMYDMDDDALVEHYEATRVEHEMLLAELSFRGLLGPHVDEMTVENAA